MSLELDLEEIFRSFIEDWVEGDERKYELQLSQILIDLEKPFLVDFSDLFTHSPDIAEYLLNNPRDSIVYFETVIQGKLFMRGITNVINRVCIENLPQSSDIRKIDYSDIGKMIQIEGIVVKTGLTEQEITNAIFRCIHCGEMIEKKQNDQFTVYPNPSECPGSGCPNPGFAIEPERSTFKKIQKISIQEAPDKVPPGRLPRTFKIKLEEKLTDSVKPGERVKIVGIVEAVQKKKRDQNPVMLLILNANNVEKREVFMSEVELSESDVERLKEQAKKRDHLKRVSDSIAPKLYGLDIIKQALALQQCEGTAIMIHEERIRGQSHILLAGDPAQGKSEILQFMSSTNPRGINITGKGSTAAGLTAAVVKDEESGEWTLMAGAMVIADGGIVCADEFEKMRNEDRSAMHPAMAQQKIPINKAGINVELNTRCSVLAACNPKLGRWNDYQDLTKNINLPIPLISRFDLIFVLKNDRTFDEEMKRVDHVLNLRKDPDNVGVPFTHEDLRKLFALARTIKPKLTDYVLEELRKFYGDVIKVAMKADGLMITLRQLDGLIRLTEASAKLHLREETTVQDARIAIKILNESLLQSGIDPETGQIDVGMLLTGVPQSLRDKMIQLVDVVQELCKSNLSGEYVTGEYLMEQLTNRWKINEDEIAKLLVIAKREGVLFQPRPGLWKIS